MVIARLGTTVQLDQQQLRHMSVGQLTSSVQKDLVLLLQYFKVTIPLLIQQPKTPDQVKRSALLGTTVPTV